MLSMLHPRPFSVMDAMLADVLSTDAHALRLGAHAGTFGTHASESSDGTYTISLEAPGVAASDVKIEVDDRQITLRCASQTGHGNRRLDYSLVIPEAFDADAAEAEVVDGLILIKCPKAAASGTRIITVSAEPAEPAAEEVRQYSLTLVAAGIAPADIELTVKGSALKVHGRSKRTGASLGPRVYKLPRNADTTQVAASQVDGLLTVTVPTRVKAGPKRLEINKLAAAALPMAMDTAEADAAQAEADAAADKEAREAQPAEDKADAAADKQAQDKEAGDELDDAVMV